MRGGSNSTRLVSQVQGQGNTAIRFEKGPEGPPGQGTAGTFGKVSRPFSVVWTSSSLVVSHHLHGTLVVAESVVSRDEIGGQNEAETPGRHSPPRTTPHPEHKPKEPWSR